MSKFVNYKECQKWALENGIKTYDEYMRFDKPNIIPSHPKSTYKNKGWISWEEFLKNGFLNYKECQKWALDNEIKTAIEYMKFDKPNNIPTTPYYVYKDNGWISWGHFLKNGVIANQFKSFVSYKECQKWAIKNNIKTQQEYRNFKKPNNIPSSPHIIYKDKGWMNWGAFLKNGNERDFVTYEECQKWAINNNIKTSTDYHKFKKPNNIPSSPHKVYKDKGWINWGHFLKNGNERDFVTYEECQKWAINNNIKSIKEYNKFKRPINIPSEPNYTYKNNGWINWYDFLNNKKVEYAKIEIARKLKISTNHNLVDKIYKHLNNI